MFRAIPGTNEGGVYLAEVDEVVSGVGRPLVYFRGRFAELGDELM